MVPQVKFTSTKIISPFLLCKNEQIKKEELRYFGTITVGAYLAKSRSSWNTENKVAKKGTYLTRKIKNNNMQEDTERNKLPIYSFDLFAYYLSRDLYKSKSYLLLNYCK